MLSLAALILLRTYAIYNDAWLAIQSNAKEVSFSDPLFMACFALAGLLVTLLVPSVLGLNILSRYIRKKPLSKKVLTAIVYGICGLALLSYSSTIFFSMKPYSLHWVNPFMRAHGYHLNEHNVEYHRKGSRYVFTYVHD
jgi:hypothetical protein